MPTKGKSRRGSKSGGSSSKKKSSSSSSRRGPARRRAPTRRVSHAPSRRSGGYDRGDGGWGRGDSREDRLRRYDDERAYLDARYGAPRRDGYDRYGAPGYMDEPGYYEDGYDDGYREERYDRRSPPRRAMGHSGRGRGKYKIRKHMASSEDDMEEDFEQVGGDDDGVTGPGVDAGGAASSDVVPEALGAGGDAGGAGASAEGAVGAVAGDAPGAASDAAVSEEVKEKIDELTNQESKVSPDTVLEAAGVEEGNPGEAISKNVLFGNRSRENYGSGGDYGAALDQLYEQLCARMVHRMRSFFQDLYARTGGDEKRFKKRLVKIQLWNQDQLNKVSRGFVVAHPDIIRYFKFAYAAVVLVMSVVVQRDESSTDVLIDSPKFVQFIHRCFIEAARHFMNTSAVLAPDIPRELKIQVQRNVDKSIRGAISTALRMMVSIDAIAPAAADEEQQYKFMEEGIGDKLEELDKELEGGEGDALDDDDDDENVGPAELSDGGLSDESDDDDDEGDFSGSEDDDEDSDEYSDEESGSEEDYSSDESDSESEEEESEEEPPSPPPKKKKSKKRSGGKSKMKKSSDDLAFF